MAAAAKHPHAHAEPTAPPGGPQLANRVEVLVDQAGRSGSGRPAPQPPARPGDPATRRRGACPRAARTCRQYSGKPVPVGTTSSRMIEVAEPAPATAVPTASKRGAAVQADELVPRHSMFQFGVRSRPGPPGGAGARRRTTRGGKSRGRRAACRSPGFAFICYRC